MSPGVLYWGTLNKGYAMTTMTVRKLIEELSRAPNLDAPVRVLDMTGDAFEPITINTVNATGEMGVEIEVERPTTVECRYCGRVYDDLTEEELSRVTAAGPCPSDDCPDRSGITPGPWVAVYRKPRTEYDPSWEVEDGTGRTATVYGEGAEAEANARLIAAAPDLLALVREVASMCTKPNAPTPGELEEDARALLASIHPL